MQQRCPTVASPRFSVIHGAGSMMVYDPAFPWYVMDRTRERRPERYPTKGMAKDRAFELNEQERLRKEKGRG